LSFLNFQLDGSESVFNDLGGDIDFRVEGDTDSNLLFVDASTDRVGIGTNSPQRLFHVLDTSSFPARIESTGISTLEIMAGDTNNQNLQFTEGSTIRWQIRSEGSTDNLRFIEGTINDRMVIEVGGNVGIGTATPDQLLHIVDLIGNPTLKIEASAAAASANFILESNTTSAGNVAGQMQGKWGGNIIGLMRFVTGDDTGNKDEGDIVFTTANGGVLGERIRITQEGNVGIGTTGPNSLLTINGTFQRKTRRTAVSTSTDGTDYRIAVTDTTATRTITISSADIAIADREFEIVDESGGAATNNNIIIATGSQLISGSATHPIVSDFGFVLLYSDGSNLFIRGKT